MKKPDYLISTPENVDLHLELAGLGSRIWAAFIDSTIVYMMLAFVLFMTYLVFILIEKAPYPRDTKTTFFYYLLGFAIFLAFFIVFGYWIFFEGTWKGQTPGKRVMNIRVIETNGQPVNWGSVCIRNLLRLADQGLAYVGVAVMLFDKNERRLGDFLAGTLVIRERLPGLSTNLPNIKVTAESGVADNRFIDCGAITPDDYHLLRTFLERRDRLSRGHRVALAKDLEEYMKTKLVVEKSPDSSEEFLETVYLAYIERGDD